MGERCVLGGCSNTRKDNVHLFRWPKKNPGISRQWTRFVNCTRANFQLTQRSVLCSDHFSDDCYANLMKMRHGFTRIPELKEDAVPSIKKRKLDCGKYALNLLTLIRISRHFVRSEVKILSFPYGHLDH